MSLPAAATAHGLRHVAIIMDGNGRWARERGLPRLEGHRRGAQVVRDITTYARELSIDFLTLFSFSAQNWLRPVAEVEGLMRLLADFCTSETDTLRRNGIRLRTIGSLDRLPDFAKRSVLDAEAATATNEAMTLTLALDYGGREELVVAAQALARQVQDGALDPAQIDEHVVASFLPSAFLPEPDLVIRTSGEQRISNFLLWQSAYAEYHFSSVRWPDFGRSDFRAALDEFGRRERRFGAVSAPPERRSAMPVLEPSDESTSC